MNKEELLKERDLILSEEERIKEKIAKQYDQLTSLGMHMNEVKEAFLQENAKLKNGTMLRHRKTGEIFKVIARTCYIDHEKRITIGYSLHDDTHHTSCYEGYIEKDWEVISDPDKARKLTKSATAISLKALPNERFLIETKYHILVVGNSRHYKKYAAWLDQKGMLPKQLKAVIKKREKWGTLYYSLSFYRRVSGTQKAMVDSDVDLYKIIDKENENVETMLLEELL